MARFTVVLGTFLAPSASVPDIQLRLVNLHFDGNIAEDYLLTVNPKGQVPALMGPSLKSPLTDSLDISCFLSQTYFPRLLGGPHQDSVMRLLAQLHRITALSLSVPPEDRVDFLPCEAVDGLLARTDLSAVYREALEFKKNFHESSQATALQASQVEQNERLARGWFADLLHVLPATEETGPPWLLGAEVGPTLLDAHGVPFISRLLDCKRQDLVPARLQEYARAIMDLPQWDEVTHGRTTMWSVSIGHVHLLDPI